MRHRVLFVLFACILAVVPVAAQERAATPPAGDIDLFEGVVAGEREAVIAEAADLPRYRIDATLIPAGNGNADATPAATPVSGLPSPADLPRIEGDAEIQYVNSTGAPLDEVFLRLYPNLRQYEAGSMEVRDVRVDGREVRLEPPALDAVPGSTPAAIDDPGAADLTLLRVVLDEPLQPGARATLSMAFTTVVPPVSEMGTNIFALSGETGTWTLAHAFPMLAGWDAAHGWDIDPPAGWSDPVFSPAAMWDVKLTSPADLVIAAPGALVAEEDAGEGLAARRFVAGPIREFTFLADPHFAVQESVVGETTVTVYHLPGNEAGAAVILDWASVALETFADAFGPYPYTRLSVVEAPGMLGAEYPQLVMVGGQFFADPENGGSRPGAIEMLVAHEVAHQWWYGLVGINPHQDAFLDEGLAEYSGVLYFERRYGPEAAEAQIDQGVLIRYLTWLVNDEDHVAHQPTLDFPDAATYYTITYRKAALGIEAIRHAAGDDAFFAALREIVATHRFGVVTPEHVRDAIAGAAVTDVDALWMMWFEDDTARVEIVMDPPSGTPVATPVPRGG